MKRSMKSLSPFFVFVFICSYANGQYTGPGSVANLEVMSVKQVKEQAAELDKTDKLVKLQGYITEQVNEDTYWFEDSSGRVWVEIDEDDLPDKPFDNKTRLTIIGEVDHDLLEEVEVEVERFLAIEPSNQ
ncbi:MAG: NirD/YgiW/YdeI family stress tolerance protein [Phaeodactylibacter sp.]|nr:NirD/YgiW/YdeI family stress tolerance protein [Sinomicrobium sp.]MCB0578302.1 NirD/YgiW/YdeI family stress tolerance protein [Phaeodactylibacter sp.]MCB9293286.1 NirD/YgiW/YdeI family stress tolerance protein [Lewinellaceae bacterium]